MERTLSNDDLYFVVLPVIRMGGPNIGLTEQILTLMPGEEFIRFADRWSEGV